MGHWPGNNQNRIWLYLGPAALFCVQRCGLTCSIGLTSIPPVGGYEVSQVVVISLPDLMLPAAARPRPYTAQ